MSEIIFHINQDGTLDELRETSYDSEVLLQRLLIDYPKLLAGEQINSNKPRNWILVSRELGIPDTENASNRWYIDHLFLDQDLFQLWWQSNVVQTRAYGVRSSVKCWITQRTRLFIGKQKN